ncbi:unnamed protein product [Fraxinus pennsylvanica]|uniref:Uncharacterized protein n=1 Tax=Fraxinus pennsylvanica TaxID=56036 RepID=A0AAD1ZDS3_9LAMI|nr:unnamed protein product [Fraxinus pennsylvanica]
MRNDTTSPTASSSCRDIRDQQGMFKMTEESMGNCPVCREVFLAKDIEHVLNLVGTHTQLDSSGFEVDEDFLKSKSELEERGMYLPRPVTSPSTESDPGSNKQQNKDPTVKSETNSDNRPSSSKHSNSSTRMHRTQNSRKQNKGKLQFKLDW